MHKTLEQGVEAMLASDLTSKISFKQKCRNILKFSACVRQIEKGYFSLVFFTELVGVSLGYLMLILSATVLNMLAEGRMAGDIVRAALICLGGCFCLQVLGSYCRNKCDAKQSIMMRKYYDVMVAEKMMKMDYSLVDSPVVRALRTRMQMDNRWGAGIWQYFMMVHGLFGNLLNIVGAVIIGVPVFGQIFHTSKVVGSLCIAFVYIIAFLLIKIQIRKMERYNNRLLNEQFDTAQERAEKHGLTWPFVTEEQFNYKNGKDVRIYDGYNLFEEYTYGRMERNEKQYWSETGKLSASMESMGDGIKSFLFGSGYFVVGLMALGGRMAVGNLVQYAGAMERMFSGVANIIWIFWEMALVCRKQLSTLEFFELEDEMYKGKLPVEKRSDHEYEIEFENVSFKYPGAQEYALKDFSLKIRIGEKMAIVGRNGSGKTTMIKLLCKLYEPTEGRILLNGVDISKFKEEEYRSLFSVVFQDFKLFDVELGENVAGSREYDRNKVMECLEKAGFRPDAEKMPKALDTYLYKGYDDSGVEISGGEAQKIAIARALYKPSSFILFDEPTAALDPLAENEIYAGFDAIVGNKTAIYISHRLSSCKFCNDIVVFDEGRLVQRGSHEELLRDTGGRYYEMWNAQARHYA